MHKNFFSHLETIPDGLAMYELLGSMTAEVGHHDLVHSILFSSSIPLTGRLVEVVYYGPDLEEMINLKNSF